MQVTFDLKKLASALSKATKGPKQDRPVSYQDYLQFLSKLSGASSYEAAVAMTQAAIVPKERNIGTWTYISKWSSGHLVSTPCQVDLDTREIVDVGIAEPDNDVEGLYEEYVRNCDAHYQVVKSYDEERMFALASAEDYEAAIGLISQSIEEASVFKINGVNCIYGLDGDWFNQIEGCFDSLGEGGSIEDALKDVTIWHLNGVDPESHDKYEYFFSAYEILFSTLHKGEDGSATLSIPTEDSCVLVKLLK